MRAPKYPKTTSYFVAIRARLATYSYILQVTGSLFRCALQEQVQSVILLMKTWNINMQNKVFAPGRGTANRPLSIDGILAVPPHYMTATAAVAAPLPQPLRVSATPPSAVSDVEQLQTPPRVALSWQFIAGVVCSVLVAGFIFYSHTHKATEGRTSPVSRAASLIAPKVSAATTPATTPTQPTPIPNLVSDMNAAIAAQPDLSAASTLIDLDTGLEYDAGNYSQQYTAASTSKLVAIFDYIHQVELGKASLTQTIQGQQAQDIIQRMIVYSDNDAWAKLNSYLKFKQEQAYVNSLGITATIQPSNLQFSTPNMAKMLQLLYQGKLMNDTNRAMIYGYMSHTTVKNLIQAVLPVDTTVYHKYGQIEGVLHDASIVEYNGHHFVLVIYTNNPAGDSTKNGEQVNLIHAVTTAAFTDVTKQ